MDEDFVITDAQSGADVIQAGATAATGGATAAPKDVAEREGFQYRERAMGMSLDDLIQETGGGRRGRGGKPKRDGGRGGGRHEGQRRRHGVGRGRGTGGEAYRARGAVSIEKRGQGNYTVLQHGMAIVDVQDGDITMNTSGQHTAESLMTLNRTLNKYGFRVVATQSGEWLVSGQNKSSRFFDGMVLHGVARWSGEPGAAGGAGRVADMSNVAQPPAQFGMHVDMSAVPQHRIRQPRPGETHERELPPVFSRLGPRPGGAVRTGGAAQQGRFNPY